MRAIVIVSPGEPAALEERIVPTPKPGPGQALVRVAASGVNRADLLQRRGLYPAPPGYPKDIPGIEFSGVVERLGPSVLGSEVAGIRSGNSGPGAGVRVGDRVMGVTGGGAYAEYVIEPLETLLAVPPSCSVVEAAAVPEAFATAFDALSLQAGLRGEETLLIHAAGSGVGTAAIQLAKAVGSFIVGSSRSAWKLDRAKELGLDQSVLIERPDEPWEKEVFRVTDGRGADVILDLVGGPYLAGNQAALAGRGRHLVVGVPGGSSSTIDLRLLMTRRGALIGTILRARSLAEKAKLVRAMEREVMPAFRTGELRPVVDRIYPAEEAEAAHAFVETNGNFGKILLAW